MQQESNDLWELLRTVIEYTGRGRCYQWARAAEDVLRATGYMVEETSSRQLTHHFVIGIPGMTDVHVPADVLKKVLKRSNVVFTEPEEFVIHPEYVGKIDSTPHDITILDGTGDQRLLRRNYPERHPEGGFYGSLAKVPPSMQQIYALRRDSFEEVVMRSYMTAHLLP